jgi:hypothetical protein
MNGCIGISFNRLRETILLYKWKQQIENSDGSMKENPYFKKFEFQVVCLTQRVENWNPFCFYEPVFLRDNIPNFIMYTVEYLIKIS